MPRKLVIKAYKTKGKPPRFGKKLDRVPFPGCKHEVRVRDLVDIEQGPVLKATLVCGCCRHKTSCLTGPGLLARVLYGRTGPL